MRLLLLGLAGLLIASSDIALADTKLPAKTAPGAIEVMRPRLHLRESTART